MQAVVGSGRIRGRGAGLRSMIMLARGVVVSALVTAALADSATTTTKTTAATTQQGEGDDTETIGAEYVVHPDIHPLERIQQWTDQIEKNNGSTWAAGAPL